MVWVVLSLQPFFVRHSVTFLGRGDLQESSHHQETSFLAQDSLRWCITAQTGMEPLPCSCRTLLCLCSRDHILSSDLWQPCVLHSLMMGPQHKQRWNRYNGKSAHNLHRSRFGNISRLFTVKFSKGQLASCCFCISHELILWEREGEKAKQFYCLTRQKTIAADLLMNLLSEVLSKAELTSVAKPITPKSTQLPKLLAATLFSLD